MVGNMRALTSGVSKHGLIEVLKIAEPNALHSLEGHQQVE
jgi:hypothetical protein